VEADPVPEKDNCYSNNIRKVERGSSYSHDCGWVGGGFCRNGGVVLRKADYTCFVILKLHPMPQHRIGQAITGERLKFHTSLPSTVHETSLALMIFLGDRKCLRCLIVCEGEISEIVRVHMMPLKGLLFPFSASDISCPAEF